VGFARKVHHNPGRKSQEVTVKIGFKTDKGKAKDVNEDSLLVERDLGLFIVADGMGGHKAGSLASSIAVEEISAHVRDALDKAGDIRSIVEQSVLKAHTAILRSSRADPDWRSDMGTTVVVAFISEGEVVISHVGDSRAYKIKNGTIKPLTHDHTFVADWVLEGVITEAEARTHKARHGLWMALGVDDDVEPETTLWPWNEDWRLLLCSDGLNSMLEDEEILGIVKSAENPQEACEVLVERANERGGKDNISIIIIC